MKKIIVLSVLSILLQVSSTAQSFKWGIRGGISTPDVKPGDLNVIQFNNLKLAVTDANYGFHGGLWTRVKLSNFMIQPEVVFNSSNVTYKINAPNIVDSVRKESFQNIDIPIMLGYKAGGLRLMAGPVGHLHINNSGVLTDVSQYSEQFNSLQWGYQAGLGLDFGGLGLDLRYEGNFSQFGEHIKLAGQSFNFSKTPNRLIVSMAISF